MTAYLATIILGTAFLGALLGTAYCARNLLTYDHDRGRDALLLGAASLALLVLGGALFMQIASVRGALLGLGAILALLGVAGLLTGLLLMGLSPTRMGLFDRGRALIGSSVVALVAGLVLVLVANHPTPDDWLPGLRAAFDNFRFSIGHGPLAAPAIALPLFFAVANLVAIRRWTPRAFLQANLGALLASIIFLTLAPRLGR